MTGGARPADFAEMIKAATLAAIKRTEARSSAAAAYARRNLEDITQAAALDALERIERGEDGEPAQLANRAANAAIMREYRRSAADAARTTPDTIRTADGDEIHPAELERVQDAPRRPEEAAEAADMIRAIIAALPAAYQADAPKVIGMSAAGYTAAETARALECSPRRVERIRAAARAAAEEMEDIST